MAQWKAGFGSGQEKCEREAKSIVENWYKKHNIGIDPESIYVVWFAYLPNGYKCMVSSKMYSNNCFEITKNKITDEVYYSVFERVEYVVHPSLSEDYILSAKGLDDSLV